MEAKLPEAWPRARTQGRNRQPDGVIRFRRLTIHRSSADDWRNPAPAASARGGRVRTSSARRSACTRTVGLLAPLREDLDAWRDAAQTSPTAPVFPSRSGAFWRATDWRNWRKRIYKPTAEAIGISGARPCDLRHAFASLLIHEGRLSIVEIAAQLGHNLTVSLDTYAHVMAEQAGGERVGPEEQIAAAREALVAGDRQLAFSGLEV